MSDQRLTLTEGQRAPAHARAWLAARLPDVPAHVAEDALLVVSELVTNAVQHGRPVIEIAIAISPDRLRVEVRDGGDALPVVPPGTPSHDRPAGRGLLIVAATAHDWGIMRLPGEPGKIVWAELAADRDTPVRFGP